MPTAPEYRSWLKIAHRLRGSGCHRVGLLAAGAEDVEALAEALARVLAELCDGSVAVLRENPHQGRVNPAPLAEGVFLLGYDPFGPTPWHDIQVDSEPYEQLLVPLSWLERRGEHVPLLALCDGVALVVRLSSASERRVTRRLNAIDKNKRLGVLLLEGTC